MPPLTLRKPNWLRRSASPSWNMTLSVDSPALWQMPAPDSSTKSPDQSNVPTGWRQAATAADNPGQSGSNLPRIAVATTAVVATLSTPLMSPAAAAKPSNAPTSSPVTATPVAAAPASVRSHKVRRGDTVSSLASRYGVSVRSLVAANNLRSADYIRRGDTIAIPAADVSSGATQVSNRAKKRSRVAGRAGNQHTVAAGETLGHIANQHSITIGALRAANPAVRTTSMIRVGQTLAVPQGSATKGRQNSSKKTGKKNVGGQQSGRTVIPNTFAGRTYPDKVVKAAQRNSDALANRPAISREAMRTIIKKQARKHGVNPALAQAIAYQESGFNMRRVSPANAIGAMQVIPSSGRWASNMAGRKLDLLDPHDNAEAGVLVLLANIRMAETKDEAIAGYYQGLASVRSRGMYADTRRYVANIRTLEKKFA